MTYDADLALESQARLDLMANLLYNRRDSLDLTVQHGAYMSNSV
jgi:hypothetical protein